MLFNSLQYALFLPLIIAIYYVLPHKFRWALLLIASYFFYMCWNVSYVALIGISTVITFLSGIFINRENDRCKSEKITDNIAKRNKKIYVAISFLINLGILVFFKYTPLMISTINSVSSAISSNIHIGEFRYLLPVGISFYTFQALSYTMDVYRGDIKASKNIGKYALFVSFFPQLVAGPIERSSHLLPQFDKVKKFDLVRSRKAFVMILWGLFKKVVIADRIAVIVTLVYSDVSIASPVALLIGTLLFALQIFCDFSAYSDIAIGSANILGFDIMENFKQPYFSKSIQEFWRRWHISLSSWFRDYLYIPLGGSRVSQGRWIFNTMVVFLISGLWHGANWTFLAWGALHGIYILIENSTKDIRESLAEILKINTRLWIFKLISMIFTFSLICFAWIFFRANSLTDAFYIIGNIFTINTSMWSMSAIMISLGSSINDLAFIGVFVIILFFVEVIQRKRSIGEVLENKIWPVRWIIYICLIFGIILLGLYGVGDASFIYFQF